MIEAELLDSGTQRDSRRPEVKLEAHDLHNRMYHTMKIQAPFTTGTRGDCSLALTLPACSGKNGFLKKDLHVGN